MKQKTMRDGERSLLKEDVQERLALNETRN